jgi:3-oxoacyl-[acyl-carrier protein] reductase
MTGLQGKVALISGANSPMGIGAAIARALSAKGVDCFLTYLRRPGQRKDIPAGEIEEAQTPGWALYTAMSLMPPDEVLNEIREAGGKAAAWEADLATAETIPMLFDKAEAEFGPVAILVNNAAHCPDAATLLDLTATSIDNTYAVNVRATLLLIAEFVRRYKKYQLGWGRIINVSTGPAQEFAGQLAYGTSKAAIEAATRAIAHEIGPLGITINTIAPGATQTGYIDKEAEEGLISTIPMGRLGEPKDIADSIAYLASSQASWITGQVIRVTGGREM